MPVKKKYIIYNLEADMEINKTTTTFLVFLLLLLCVFYLASIECLKIFKISAGRDVYIRVARFRRAKRSLWVE